MIIKSLNIVNFRNIENKTINFDTNLTKIEGNNGFGKTSILEAIYFILNNNSYRSSKKETIKDKNIYTKISLLFDNNETIDMLYNEKITKTFINYKPITSYSELNDYNKIIFINPSDFNLVFGSITAKRKIIDNNLIKLNFKYKDILLKIKKLNKEKKEIIKLKNLEKLILINQQINELVIEKNQYREKYLITIQKSGFISNQVEIKYTYTLNKNIENISENELKYKKSKLTIDSDKIDFLIQGSNIKNFLSRGEIKKFIFEVFKAQEYLLREELKIIPIILIDDLSAEFDKKNSNYVLNLFKDNQVIYTKIKDGGNGQ